MSSADSGHEEASAFYFHAAEGGWLLDTPYSPDFVGVLKASLPRPHRKWRPDDRCWWVHDRSIREAIAIMARFWPVEGPPIPETKGHRTQPPPGAPPRTQSRFETACARLCVTPQAPAEVVKAAHRALVSLHHPDRGGDTATMAAINAAYDTWQATAR